MSSVSMFGRNQLPYIAIFTFTDFPEHVIKPAGLVQGVHLRQPERHSNLRTVQSRLQLTKQAEKYHTLQSHKGGGFSHENRQKNITHSNHKKEGALVTKTGRKNITHSNHKREGALVMKTGRKISHTPITKGRGL